MTSIDIVGNGPSAFLHEKGARPYIHCNLPPGNQQPDFICIIDHQPIDWMAVNDYETDTPVLLATKAKNAVVKHGLELDCVHEFTRKEFMNSGQAAVLWASGAYQTVYLWGFDSMISGVTDSTMDSRVMRTRSLQLDRRWDTYWIDIFSKYPNNQYLVCGKGTNVLKKDYGKNVTYHKIP